MTKVHSGNKKMIAPETKDRRYCVILGTRPEIIKLYSIIKYLSDNNKDFFIIHTNQHYSENMDAVFFKELGLDKPRYNLNIGSGTHGKQTGLMLQKIEEVLMKERPYVVLVEGDTNTVLAGALAAAKLHIKVAHVEAGLRSYFREMPEELNRIMTDHISDYLFAPTENQKKILLSEGIPKDKAFVVGNSIVDAVNSIKDIAEKKSSILKDLRLKSKAYIVVTAHRQENVDDFKRFKGIMEGIAMVAKDTGKTVIYPIHPRAKKMLEQFGLRISENIRLIEPIGYLDMIQLMNNSALIMTDSGGLQEESCILQVPCVTLRDNTERPETITSGGNILAGTNPEKILKCAKQMLSKKSEKNNKWNNPFGDGQSGKKIIEIIEKS